MGLQPCIQECVTVPYGQRNRQENRICRCHRTNSQYQWMAQFQVLWPHLVAWKANKAWLHRRHTTTCLVAWCFTLGWLQLMLLAHNRNWQGHFQYLSQTCDSRWWLVSWNQVEINHFNEKLEESLNDANFMVDGEGDFESMYLEDMDEDSNPGISHGDIRTTPSTKDYDDMHTNDRPDDDDEEAIDKHLNAELIMDVGMNDEQWGCIVKHSWWLDDDPIGRAQANLLFDARECEVKFTDGFHMKYQANIIAKNMFAQEVDNEGNHFLLLKEITDHKWDHSVVLISDGMICTPQGTTKSKVTIHGWHLLVLWQDRSASWLGMTSRFESI